MMTEGDFHDSKEWSILADRLLPSYSLPRWKEACSVGAMRLWAERLNIPSRKGGVTAYEIETKTTMAEFMELNPAWPLRSFVGLMLEYAEGNHGQPQK